MSGIGHGLWSFLRAYVLRLGFSTAARVFCWQWPMRKEPTTVT